MLKDELIYEEIIPGILRFISSGAEREWVARAACRGMDTNIWFPDKGETVNANVAMAICQTCPVQQECLEYGLQEKNGIWGGMSVKQRRLLPRLHDVRTRRE